ncbi:hypothetical protein Q73_01835 [Bacillus coahuilensis m2-6]|uniref:rhodanese-like domain-containing protein n=1 Tax=Bacillus coahuilensis TaxID=408580 RepID=UPI0007502276|nr:rhodanese-like domain-containing protein [Bacillus coahuilensis]KUP09648.1 hypothetical protein Q73_01835 [Bacillus coahuilensis m2-6]
MKRTILALVSLVIFLTACVNQQDEKYETISLDKVNELRDNVQVIDVRTPDEYHSGHIPNAINIPLDDIENQLTSLDQYEPFILICQSGNRSQQASEILAKNEVSGFYNAEDGMRNWEYEIE